MPRCGNCKASHDTAAEVKSCYGASAKLPDASLPAPHGDELTRITTQAHGRGATNADRATEKQLAFIDRLVAERDTTPLEGGILGERLLDVGGGKFVSKQEASDLIDNLTRLPKIETAQRTKIDDGIYVLGDDTYKIVHAVHGSGKQYAKKLVQGATTGTWSWKYVGREPLTRIRSEHRMTQEQAAEFGKLYGICVRCAADLTREQSIHVGYGPTCAKNEGWWYPTKRELAELTR